MANSVDEQQTVFEHLYASQETERWSFHDTPDVLIRYLRDRRIRIAVERLKEVTKGEPADWNALVVCGGVGGEGTLLANLGFREVTVSDFSAAAIEICSTRDPRLRTCVLNAEQLDLADESFDVVLVQDGLHHLPRPVLGLTEMLRVARKAAIVIEPHAGLVGSLLGTEWERHDDALNYVFRWDRRLLKQVTSSLLLQRSCDIKAIRIWDHVLVMQKIAKLFGGGRKGKWVVSACYALLNGGAGWLGNMFIGVVVKNPDRT